MSHPSQHLPPRKPLPPEITPTSVTILSVHDLPPTLTVEQAAEILGCGRSLAYDLIRRGEFPSPVLRLGNRRYVIPTAELLRALGLDISAPSTAQTTGDRLVIADSATSDNARRQP